MKEKTLWITRTAVCAALLVVLQAVTASWGNTLITGSVVNLLLIVSVMTCGLSSGSCVAVLSPVLAKLIGIGPFWSLIPFIVAGNLSLVLIWHCAGNRQGRHPAAGKVAALIAAAVAKFLVLYVGIVRIAVPIILRLSEPQATVVSNLFSFPQLITALAGGAAALCLLPLLQKAIAGGGREN